MSVVAVQESVLLVAARLLPIALVTPLVGGRWAPAGGRISLTVICAALVCAAHAHGSAGGLAGVVASSRAVPLWLLVVREVLLGATIAFVVALVFEAARAGFSLLGYALVAASGAGARSPASLVELGSVWLVATFFIIDGPVMVVRGLAASYRRWPPGQVDGPALGLSGEALGHLLDSCAQVIAVALAIASPVLVTCLLAGVSLALWRRVHPHLVGVRDAGGAVLWLGVLSVLLSCTALAVLLLRLVQTLPTTMERFLAG